jgi:hypothetical protein
MEIEVEPHHVRPREEQVRAHDQIECTVHERQVREACREIPAASGATPPVFHEVFHDSATRLEERLGVLIARPRPVVGKRADHVDRFRQYVVDSRLKLVR